MLGTDSYWRLIRIFQLAFRVHKTYSKRKSISLEETTRLIVCIGVSTPPQTHHPLFFVKPPLKSVNCPRPFFLGDSLPIYIVFSWTTPYNRIFQWTPIILKFPSLNPSHLLKVTKFLIKISQFKFLVITFLFINFFCH